MLDIGCKGIKARWSSTGLQSRGYVSASQMVWLSCMKNQHSKLFTETSKLLIYFSTRTWTLKYLILAWLSSTKKRIPTSALELLELCDLLVSNLSFFHWDQLVFDLAFSNWKVHYEISIFQNIMLPIYRFGFVLVKQKS